MTKKLSELLHSVTVLSRKGSPETGTYSSSDPDIAGLAYDSRAVKPDFLFFALPGLHVDGAVYIPQAVKNGASVIVHQNELKEYIHGPVYVQVEDARFVMSPISDAFFDFPSSSLTVIGVTGTEGKSTTVFLIYQLLRLAGRKTGFISTVQYSLGGESIDNPEHQTTPEAPVIQEKLALMRDAGVDFAVVESSSHGLSRKTNRLGDVRFDCGVMMNVTHEHLEFHGTHEQYKSDKANLFRFLDTASHIKKRGNAKKPVQAFGVVNMEDPAASYFAGATKQNVFGFAPWSWTCTQSADFLKQFPYILLSDSIESDSSGVNFEIVEGTKRLPARIELPGAFNVSNTLAALISVSWIAGRPIEEFIPLLTKLKPVRGRMTVIDKGQPFEVVVDYAHTPSSFMAVLPPLRKRIKGRIISIFGSGGERDTQKRPEQGRIAAEYSDIVVLTDEDPRGEDPMKLLEMIAAGCPELRRGKELYLIPDRPQAIRKAFSLAQKGDLVLLLGKGHENSIIYKTHTMPYDEITEAETALTEMGWNT